MRIYSIIAIILVVIVLDYYSAEARMRNMKGGLSKNCHGRRCRTMRKPWNRTRKELRLGNLRRYGINSWNRQQRQRKIEERLQENNPNRTRPNKTRTKDGCVDAFGVTSPRGSYYTCENNRSMCRFRWFSNECNETCGLCTKGNKPCIGVCQHYKSLGIPNPYE